MFLDLKMKSKKNRKGEFKMKLENDMVVHCDTKEKAKKLIKMIENAEMGTLEDNERQYFVDRWDEYKEETCYRFNLDSLLSYCYKSWYENRRYDVVEFDDLFDDLDLSSYENENQNSEPNTDLVNHPKHYQLKNGLEVIDVVEAFTDGLEGIDAVDIGNAVKYLGRLGKKDNNIQEVNKAIWYLKHYVDRRGDEINGRKKCC